MDGLHEERQGQSVDRDCPDRADGAGGNVPPHGIDELMLGDRRGGGRVTVDVWRFL